MWFHVHDLDIAVLNDHALCHILEYQVQITRYNGADSLQVCSSRRLKRYRLSNGASGASGSFGSSSV